MIVADSSPLIALGRVGHLDLLHELFDTVLIPEAVSNEISQRAGGFATGRPDWIVTRAVDESDLVTRLRLTLDPGEAEAIALAVQLQIRLVVDDDMGRSIAASLGLDFTGTLGALVLAKDRQLIDRVEPLVNALLDDGFYISARVVAEVLRRAGESA